MVAGNSLARSGGILTLNAAERESARRFFQALQLRRHEGNLEFMVGHFSNTGRFRCHAHVTQSLLSSSSLITSLLLHQAIRNEADPVRQNVRELFSLLDTSHPNWFTTRDQGRVYSEIGRLLRHFECTQRQLEELAELHPDDKELQARFSHAREQVAGLRRIYDGMEQSSCATNTFPVIGMAEDKIRGIQLQAAGPNRGSRSVKTQLSAGTTESHSSYKVFDESKRQWLSRIGVTGVQVKIVHGFESDYLERGFAVKTPRGSTTPFKVTAKRWFL